jgi:hypothetical protein
MEESFDVFNLSEKLRRNIGQRKYDRFDHSRLFLTDDNNPQYNDSNTMMLHDALMLNVGKVGIILNTNNNNDLYDGIESLENIIFNLLLDYRPNENI